MSAETVKAEVSRLAGLVNARLATCLKDASAPIELLPAMEYSLLAGGKRLRPGLCLTWAGLLGVDEPRALDFACALELIHTYSLIHDDLPAMDDDDLRRGRPSNHKVFGEATAILAGDGLLTEAFVLMLSGDFPARRLVEAARTAAKAAGAGGMVGGQAVDMRLTGEKGVALPDLKAMHAMKTGALIRAACECGAILAGGSPSELAAAHGYGAALGVAFQIADDVLDVVGDEKTIGKPVGSDERQGKATYPALVGLDKSRELAREAAAEACGHLDHLADKPGARLDFLRGLATYVVERVG